MSNIYLLLIVALIAGVVLPVQTAVNNRMAVSVGSPILGAFISFVIGTLSIFAYALVSGESLSSLTSSKNAPAIAWIGGLLGAFFVTSTIILLPRIGVAMTISLVIAGQMIAALVMDHYGLLGVPVKEMNLWRIAGVILIVGGVVLIRRF
jgi:bacterial/archaeal transporter family-2 protein